MFTNALWKNTFCVVMMCFSELYFKLQFHIAVFRSWLNFGHQLNPALLGKTNFPAPAPVPWSWLKTSSSSAALASAPAKKAQKLLFQLRLSPPWNSLLFVRWNQVLRTKTYRNIIKICFYFRWKASMARILKNIVDLFSKQEKNTRYTQFAKITEHLRSYQVQRDILVDE